MKPHIRKILVSLLLVLCLISTAKVLTQWMAAEEGDDSYAGAVAIAQSATLATSRLSPCQEQRSWLGSEGFPGHISHCQGER